MPRPDIDNDLDEIGPSLDELKTALRRKFGRMSRDEQVRTLRELEGDPNFSDIVEEYRHLLPGWMAKERETLYGQYPTPPALPPEPPKKRVTWAPPSTPPVGAIPGVYWPGGMPTPPVGIEPYWRVPTAEEAIKAGGRAGIEAAKTVGRTFQGKKPFGLIEIGKPEETPPPEGLPEVVGRMVSFLGFGEPLTLEELRQQPPWMQAAMATGMGAPLESLSLAATQAPAALRAATTGLKQRGRAVLATGERGAVGPFGEAKAPWEMTHKQWLDATNEDVFTRIRTEKGRAAAAQYKGKMDYGIPDKWIPDKLKSGKLSESRGHFDTDKHKLIIQRALSEGKPVPAEVLADYPDLAAKVKPPVTPAVAKEPWQMTREEWKQAVLADSPEYAQRSQETRRMIDRGHRESVQQALSSGKLVPPEVLAEYPDLAAKVKPPVTELPKAEGMGELPLPFDETGQAARPWGSMTEKELRTIQNDAPPGSYSLRFANAELERRGIDVLPPVGWSPAGTKVKPPVTEIPKVAPEKEIFPGITETPPPPAPPPALPPSPPSVPPPASPLGRVERMWQPGKKPREWGDTYLKTQEYANDIYYGLRRLQTQVAKGVPVSPGSERDLITMLTLSPGAPQVGATRYVLLVDELKQVFPQLQPLDLNTYIYVKHAKEILAEKGINRLLSLGLKADDLDLALVELEKKLGGGFANLEKAADVVKRTYTQELDAMVAEGLIKADLAKVLKAKYPWYNPLQYVDDAEKLAAQGQKVSPFSVISSGLKRLSAVGTEAAARPPLEVLGEQLIKNEVRRQKNQIARAIIALAQEAKVEVKKVKLVRPVAQVEEGVIFRPLKGDVPGTISYFEDGIRQVYEVPQWMYREAEVLNRVISNPVSALVGGINGISRAAFTTFSPAFVVSNILNDSLAAFIRGGVLPWQTAKALMRSVKGLEGDPIMQAFRLAGGYQMRFFGRGAGTLAKEVGATGGKVIKPGQPILKRLVDAIPRAGEVGEQAPRMAKFKSELDKTLPGWRKMTPEAVAKTPQARAAAAKAVEVTINFARGAYLIKAANPFIIFLNASMEGVKLPIRALRESKAARIRLAAVVAGGLGIDAYNMSYSEYWDVPNDIRWGSFFLMLPSTEKDAAGNPKPNYIVIIPRTREWAALLGSKTYAMEKLFKDNPQSFGQFTKTIVPMLSPISEIPAPEVLLELFEQQANWDFYYSSPVVPPELKELPPEEQITPWTSKTLAEIGEAVKVSPIRLQHGISGILGGAGRSGLSVSDYILRLLKPDVVDPAMQEIVKQYKEADAIDRNKLWMSLSPTERDNLETLLRQPEKGIPVFGPVVRRFYPQRGGQIYRTGQELAATTLGVSIQQTERVRRALRDVGDKHLIEQEKLDKALDQGKLKGSDWREERKKLGQRYQGALDTLGIQFPNAAQVIGNKDKANQYYKMIATLAGTTPDRREKAVILAGGWYNIQLQEPAPGSPDWDSFFKARDAYKNSLSAEDKALLEEYLESRMTPQEKRYSRIQEYLKPYWNLEAQVWSQYGAQAKTLKDLATQLDVMATTDERKAKQFMLENPQLVSQVFTAQKQIANLKLAWKAKHPDEAALLKKFYTY